MKDKEADDDLPTIEQCYVCRAWLFAKVIRYANVPDQTGYVKKPVCKSCIDQIRDRSFGTISNQPTGY